MARKRGSQRPTSDSKDARHAALEGALAAAEASPGDMAAWDRLEDLAAAVEEPDGVGALYARMLDASLPKVTAAQLTERSVRFYDEWFGDTPAKVSGLLGRIYELDASAAWAFERLVMLLTSQGQWDELLGVYDRRLATTDDVAVRRRLLEDAAQVAKDFAEDGDRAARYVQAELALEPDNAQLAGSLERLLERQGRHAELVLHWASRLERLGTEDARELRLRMAATQREKLDQPERAVATLEVVLAESPGHRAACTELERILTSEKAALEVRRGALGLLRQAHVAAARSDELIRVLECALGFVVDDGERRALNRELAMRLAVAGRELDALNQYRELVTGDPHDADARRQLRTLAARARRPDVLADALEAAANACSDAEVAMTTRLEAAEVRHRQLEDVDGAAALYARVVADEARSPSHALSAAHRLRELYASAGEEEKQLEVLEHLARLEPSAFVRRNVETQAARLSDRLGDVDRALLRWRDVLALEPTDFEARTAIVGLLERARRWPELASALQECADLTEDRTARRAYLVRLAKLEDERLGAHAKAAETWTRVGNELGFDRETIAAVDRLLSQLGRHEELARLLDATAEREQREAAALVARLGAVHATVGNHAAALKWYRHVLAFEPTSAEARAGLSLLLSHAEHGASACHALAVAYEHCGDARELLSLLEQRLATTDDRHARARILSEASRLHARIGSPTASSIECLARALGATPEDRELEAQLVRFAETTGTQAEAAVALAAACSGISDPARKSELFRRAGAWFEASLDGRSALNAFEAAVLATPDDTEPLRSVARLASLSGDLPRAASASVAVMGSRAELDRDIVRLLEDAAAARANGFLELAAAMEAALSTASVSDELAHQLELVIASWYLERAADREGASRLLSRALARRPSDREVLRALVAIERGAGGRVSVETLLALDALEPRGLDALFEAAELGAARGEAAAASLAERLFYKACELATTAAKPTGERSCEAALEWALERLVAHFIAAAQPERATGVLLDGARHAGDAARAVALRRRAAEMLAEAGFAALALDAYRAVLDACPQDRELFVRVAALSEGHGRLADALALRERARTLTTDVDARLALGLACARLGQKLEADGGPVATLLDNLTLCPGHADTISLLRSLLVSRGRHRDLAHVLRGQAEALEASEQRGQAAVLYAEVGRMAQTVLGDRELSLAAHARVVELDPSALDSVDQLASLTADLGDFAAAARWLELRLAQASAAERVAVLLRLARAQQRADQADLAMATLERAFDEAPRNSEARKLLFQRYRTEARWEELARALSRAALAVGDEATVVGYARDAAAIYFEKLDLPAEAVPVLRRALELDAKDRRLASMLAEGLIRSGEHEEAATLLRKCIDDFGRRRSAERAQSHHMLSRALQSQGLVAEAIAELETASQMDTGNLAILVALADLAQTTGDFDRAERALRTLLITVKREQKPDALPIGATEILFELAHLADKRGQAGKAKELAESAFEALTPYDLESGRLEPRLLAREQHELHARLIDLMLARVSQPHRRARLFAQKANVLDVLAGRQAEALDYRLRAVESDPGSPVHQQAAFAAAQQAGELDRYVSVVEALLSDERADASSLVRCELLLRLGEVLEKARGDNAHAVQIYEKARGTGVRRADVCRAQARVALARGDEEEHLRLLSELASFGENEAETRVDALYRMAEVHLATADTINEGLEALGRATKEAFRAERAAEIVRGACVAHPEIPELLEAYERIARRAENPGVLLGFLEHRAQKTRVSVPEVEEATQLAERLGRPDIAEALMSRAAELGSAGGPESQRGADWAFFGLAEGCLARGELGRAAAWLADVAEHADEARLFALAKRIAEQAAPTGDGAALTAKLYERLLERAPTARDAWLPLGEAYVRLGEREKLVRMVDGTLDAMQDSDERNELRMLMARALLPSDEGASSAVSALEAVLLEAPEHAEARGLLAAYFERTGNSTELVELLARQLDVAEEHGDTPLVRATAMKLGACLVGTDRERALDVYRRALVSVPDDAELVETLHATLGTDAPTEERAELLELLIRIAPPPRAARCALEVAGLYDELGNSGAATSALRRASERAPEESYLTTELTRRFREANDHAGLAGTLMTAAERATGESQVALWLEAALVYRDNLGDAPRARELLARVASSSSSDFELTIEVAVALGESGDYNAAVAGVATALAATNDPEWRLRLLSTRAKLYDDCGEQELALLDASSAFDIDPASAAQDLELRLEERRTAAAVAEDREAESRHTKRSIEVLSFQSKHDAAAELLRQWTVRAPDDLDGLRRLSEFDRRAGRWREVVTSCERLLDAALGGERIDAVLALTNAHRELGTLEHVRAALETVSAEHPAEPRLRAELAAIYEALGDNQKLASVLAADAQATEDVPARAALLLRAGRLYTAAGDAASAVSVLATAVQNAPENADAVVALSDAYTLGGWLDDSNALLDAAIEATKGKRTAEVGLFFHRKAHLADVTGDYRTQLAWLVEAHACAKRNGYIACELANLAEHLQDWELAAKTLRAVSLLETDCPITKAEAFYRQGRIAHYQGDEKNARMWARRARREDAVSPAIEAFLVELGEPLTGQQPAKK